MRLFCAFAVCVLCVFLVHGLALISLIQIMSAVPSSSSYHIAHTQLFYLFLSFYLSLIANRNSFQLRLLGLFFFFSFASLVSVHLWRIFEFQSIKKIVIWFIHDCALAFQPLWAFIRYDFSSAMAFQPFWLFNRYGSSTFSLQSVTVLRNPLSSFCKSIFCFFFLKDFCQ